MNLYLSPLTFTIYKSLCQKTRGNLLVNDGKLTVNVLLSTGSGGGVHTWPSNNYKHCQNGIVLLNYWASSVSELGLKV